MSAATALLLWVEHLVVPTEPIRPGSLTRSPIALAVQTPQTIQPGKWDEIVISYRDRLPTTSAVALAASAHQMPYHFVIDQTGQVCSLANWKEQQTDIAGTKTVSRAVRVCLAGSNDATTVSGEQWDALISLLRQLRATCQLPTKSVRLDPQSDPLARPNAPQPVQRLHQMLVAADIIE